jgi:Zn-dependent protease
MHWENNMLKIVTIAGIPIKVHWSFIFTILIIMGIILKNQLSFVPSCFLFLFVFVLFLLVIMHEYGHAMMARRFNVKTRDIIITPIGGIARLEDMPKVPTHEFLVAFAGPLVNLFFAIFFGIILFLLDTEDFFLREKEQVELLTDPIGFLLLVTLMNCILFVFNLIPAFPMDGGRILRSVLSMFLPRRKATIIAANIGRLMAIGFIFFGLYNRMFSLIFIGTFIYLMATKEYHMTRIEHDNT